jgi:hypothetical protein
MADLDQEGLFGFGVALAILFGLHLQSFTHCKEIAAQLQKNRGVYSIEPGCIAAISSG